MATGLKKNKKTYSELENASLSSFKQAHLQLTMGSAKSMAVFALYEL
jgi:hypothetical protein